MLKLKKLRFKNIGRFLGQQEILFDNLGNLIQIDAENRLTQGSSGSGKSTIFNALDWLLGFSDLSTAVIQSRLTREAISIEGLFDWDGKKVRIHRSRKLSVTIDDVTTEGSAKLAEEQIDLILGMPRHLFRLLLHRRQGENGFFLNQNPSQMNSFLTDCLNLGPIRSKIDTIDLKIKELAPSKTQLQSDLQASHAALEAIKSAQISLGQEPIPSITETVMEGWRIQYESSQKLLEDLKATIQTEKRALDLTRPKMLVEPYDRTQFDAIENDFKELGVLIEDEADKERCRQSELNGKISSYKLECYNETAKFKTEHNTKVAEIRVKLVQLNNTTLEGKRAKAHATNLANQIKIIRDGLCHTCQREWITDQAKEEEQKLLVELGKHRADIEVSVAAAAEIEALNATLASLTEQLNTKAMEIAEKHDFRIEKLIEEAKPQTSTKMMEFQTKLQSVHVRKKEELYKEDAYNVEQNAKKQKLFEIFFTEQKALTDKHQKALNQVTQEIAEYRSEFEQAVMVMKSHKDALTRYKNSWDSLKKQEEEVNLKVVEINSKVVEISENVELAEEAKRCLKSYLSCSFDDALGSISETATNLLRATPTMANATIRLEGTKETTSGSIKEAVNAVLDNDGELGVPIKSLSGGERSAVDLALDLAVISLIEEQTNRGIDVLCLDEIFNGYDSIGIENALEMLKTFGINKKLLLVEHDGIAKEFIQDKITVVREGEISYIK